MAGKHAVLGVGNPLNPKDMVGLILAKEVGHALNWEVVYAQTTGLEVIDLLLPYDRVVVIDAVEGKKFEDIEVFFPETAEFQTEYSHSVGLLETLSIGKMLMGDDFPECIVIGVGTRGMDEIDSSVDKIVKKIISAIKRYPNW